MSMAMVVLFRKDIRSLLSFHCPILSCSSLLLMMKFSVSCLVAIVLKLSFLSSRRNGCFRWAECSRLFSLWRLGFSTLGGPQLLFFLGKALWSSGMGDLQFPLIFLKSLNFFRNQLNYKNPVKAKPILGEEHTSKLIDFVPKSVSVDDPQPIDFIDDAFGRRAG